MFLQPKIGAGSEGWNPSPKYPNSWHFKVLNKRSSGWRGEVAPVLGETRESWVLRTMSSKVFDF